MGQQTRKRKRFPQRTCVACRAVRPKRELVRIVRTPEGCVAVDETGKKSGRGAYLCPDLACWEKALSKGQLDRALRVNLKAGTRDRLREYAADLRPPRALRGHGTSVKGVGEDE